MLELQDAAWPPETVPRRAALELVHDPTLNPVTLIIAEGDTVVAALAILSKGITHAGWVFRAGGLSTVVTRADVRGRGYGRRLIRSARARMRHEGFDLCLFTCDRPPIAFYEQGGFSVLPGTVLVGGTREEPFPSDQPGFDKVTLGAFFTDIAQRYRGSFEHARIELHPGAIDKLW